VIATHSLVEEGQLVSTAKHADHQESHGAHRTELSPVAQQRKGDEGVLVAEVLPSEEDTDEHTTQDEQ
jgi:hypothetical protein